MKPKCMLWKNPQTYHTNSIGADTSEQSIRISSIGTDEGEKTYVSTHTFSKMH